MRTFIYLTLIIVLLLVSLGVVNIPLSVVKSYLNDNFPEISFSEIEGTIWSGRIENVSYAGQRLGDLNTDMDLRNLNFSLIDSGVELKGTVKVNRYIFSNQIEFQNTNLLISSKLLMRNLPNVSELIGENLNIIFDFDRCYEISGNARANILRKNVLNLGSDISLIADLSCKEGQLYGSFISSPNENYLSGFFYVDNKLNYNLKASSKNIFSRISKILNEGILVNPEIKVSGNLYELFYGD